MLTHESKNFGAKRFALLKKTRIDAVTVRAVVVVVLYIYIIIKNNIRGFLLYIFLSTRVHFGFRTCQPCQPLFRPRAPAFLFSPALSYFILESYKHKTDYYI